MTTAPPALLFAGDTHGTLHHLAAVPDDCVVIHLGDFELEAPLEEALPAGLSERFWWIPGNHDCDRQHYYAHLFDSALADRNLHARVVQFGTLRVAGLGGVFKGKVWRPPDPPRIPSPKDYLRHLPRRDYWRGGVPLKVRDAIWFSDWEALSKTRAHILVTHEAPESHHHGFQALGDLARAMGAHTVVHGHHHTDYVAEIAGGIRVIGVGLRSVADLNGARLIVKSSE